LRAHFVDESSISPPKVDEIEIIDLVPASMHQPDLFAADNDRRQKLSPFVKPRPRFRGLPHHWRFAASGWWDAAPKNQVRY
jgi:hypothetical protein